MTQLELMQTIGTCQHPSEAFGDEGVCIICKGQRIQEQDELRLFRSRLGDPQTKLAGDSKVVHARRWWRQFWAA
jgi:hypothetical protein